MKNYILFIAALLLATAVAGQNVGIGTTDPQATLHISDGSGERELVKLYSPPLPPAPVIQQTSSQYGVQSSDPGWQSFKATESGTLHSVAFYQNLGSTITLSIYEGAGTGGRRLGAFETNVAGDGLSWTRTSFMNIPISSGNTYTVYSSNARLWYLTETNPYSEGVSSRGGHVDYAFIVYMGSEEEKQHFRITGPEEASPSVLSVSANIGIGTNTPRAPLHVRGEGEAITTGPARYFSHSNGITQLSDWTGKSAGFFEGNVVSTASFIGASNVTFSDERIKKVKGVSDGSRDLATLNRIEVTDYSMIDSLNHSGTYKKVIAQQVERHLPQAVSRYSDYIPSVYAIAGSVVCDAAQGRMVIKMNAPHGLASGDQVKLITEKEGEQLLSVASVSGEQAFTVVANGCNWGEVFVYGKKVDDFRVVDYDAIAMLNVSATQELYRLLTEAKARATYAESQIESLDKRMRELEQQNQRLEAGLGESEKRNNDLRNDVATLKAILLPDKIAGKK